MAKKTNQIYVGLTVGILVVLAVVGVILYLNYVEDKETGVSIRAGYFNENGQFILLDGDDAGEVLSVVTFPGDSIQVTNAIALEATIQAGSGANQATIYITSITAQNTPGTNVYQTAIDNMANPYTFPLVLNPGDSDGGDDTRWSGAIDVTQIELGDVDFTMRIQGYFFDAQGQQVPLDITSDPYTINIITEETNLFRTTSLSYDSDTGVAYRSACDGQLLKKYGGTSGSCFEFDCNTGNENFIAPGGFKAWERNANELCICFGQTLPRKFTDTDGSKDAVDDSVLYTGANTELSCSTSPQCITGDWQDDACNVASCVDEMHQIRTSTPPGCNPVTEQCVPDVSCQAPSCGDGVINQPGEDCDTGDLGGAQCSDIIPGTTGNLVCDMVTNPCTLDVSDCHVPTQDVAVRTNVNPGSCGNYDTETTLPSGQGAWIAYDLDGDGSLEGYGRSSGACTSPDGTLSYNAPGGCNLQYDGDDICVSYGGSYPRRYKTSYYPGGGVLSLNPTEPYTSNGQEVLE